MRFILVLFLATFFLAPPACADIHGSLTEDIFGKVCRHGLHPQPNNGAFAVLVFCEDEDGTFLAVVCYSAEGCERGDYPNGTTRFRGWEHESRVWQEEPWTSDVESIAWSADGKSLFVATSENYGSGAIYQLHLEDRKFIQVVPEDKTATVSDPGPGYNIDSIDKDGKFLHYHVHEIDDNEHIERLKLPLMSAQELTALAEKGGYKIQDKLAWMYAEGWDVLQDYKEAYFWYSLAAAHAPEKKLEEKRDETAQHLTLDQKAAADRRIAERLKDHPAPAAAPATHP